MGCGGCGGSSASKSNYKKKKKKQTVSTRRTCPACKWPMSKFNSYNKAMRLRTTEWKCINKKCGKKQIISNRNRS